jgi:hypothetical protein
MKKSAKGENIPILPYRWIFYVLNEAAIRHLA